jgi:hypothetical protein
MARTQKNKATEGHLGMLKARLAKLRSEVKPLLIVALLVATAFSCFASLRHVHADDATNHWRRFCWAWL